MADEICADFRTVAIEVTLRVRLWIVYSTVHRLIIDMTGYCCTGILVAEKRFLHLPWLRSVV